MAARHGNRYEIIIDRTLATWKRRERTMVDRLRGGAEPPFQERLTPKRLEELQALALAGNAAAEETLLRTLANTWQLAEDMRRGGG